MSYENINPSISRRTALGAIAGVALGAGALSAQTADDNAAKANLKGRIKQSVCRWCYNNTIPDFDAFCRACAEMGIVGVDLIGEQEWPTAKKYGLVSTMVPGVSNIENGLNEKKNHEKILANFKRLIPLAAENKYPNVICFSGNRRGMSDEQGIEVCAEGLKEAVKIAEDHDVTICMELLNSKVNHKDYQCDLTAWGVELCKAVGSPRFKLLYDIYHMQIMEGDLIRNIKDYHQYIGHYHTGGNPGRNEIDETQEIYYPAVVRAIIETGFDGYMAHEFIPKRDPLTSLKEAVVLCDV